MPKVLKEGELYAGRPEGVAILNCSIDREALAILKQHAATKKSYGHFVSRLLHEYRARAEERAKLRQLLDEQEEATNVG